MSSLYSNLFSDGPYICVEIYLSPQSFNKMHCAQLHKIEFLHTPPKKQNKKPKNKEPQNLLADSYNYEWRASVAVQSNPQENYIKNRRFMTRSLRSISKAEQIENNTMNGI